MTVICVETISVAESSGMRVTTGMLDMIGAEMTDVEETIAMEKTTGEAAANMMTETDEEEIKQIVAIKTTRAEKATDVEEIRGVMKELVEMTGAPTKLMLILRKLLKSPNSMKLLKLGTDFLRH